MRRQGNRPSVFIPSTLGTSAVCAFLVSSACLVARAQPADPGAEPGDPGQPPGTEPAPAPGPRPPETRARPETRPTPGKPPTVKPKRQPDFGKPTTSPGPTPWGPTMPVRPPVKKTEKKTRVGLGASYQLLIAPQFIVNMYWRAAKADSHNWYKHAVGGTFLIRKPRLDISLRVMGAFLLGKEDDGNYLRNDRPWTSLTYSEFHDVRFIWLDAVFVYYWNLVQGLHLGIGGGLGVGFLTGKIMSTRSYLDSTRGLPCDRSNFSDCSVCHPRGITCDSKSCDRSDLRGHPERYKDDMVPALPAAQAILSLRYDIWKHTSLKVNTGLFFPGFWMFEAGVYFPF